MAVAAARTETVPWGMLTPEQAQADVDALMASPPPTPGSQVVSDSPMSDDDDNFEPTNVPVLTGKGSEGSSSIEKASTDIEKTTPAAATD
ncbi:hypothetical protein V7S43_009657 [Phytophthora oleae]|uniref:Uncharacterized protein n=1 Tax=Phytophthora oleae TaxID=2107226 RepID=A0ABD3FFV0_9STRA